MLNFEDNTHDEDIKFQKFEFSAFPFESFDRQRPPFFPFPGGNIPPIGGNYPPDFNQPGDGFNQPGDGFNQPGFPKSAPPNYIPNKNDKGIQSFTQSDYGPGAKAVSPNSIRFCLFKFTYIWERSGRNYWAFLVNVNRESVSGYRWLRRNWVYFGLSLRRIDSFVCYNRASSEDNWNDSDNLRHSDNSILNSTMDYSLSKTRDIYTQTLTSMDIPEIKEDFLTKDIGYVDNVNLTSDIPCMKSRTTTYKINLEVSYASDLNQLQKNKINEFANESCIDAKKIISLSRSSDDYSNSDEDFTITLTLIPNILKTFSDSFNSKLNQLDISSDKLKSISYSIRQENVQSDWRPYFYNDLMF